MYWAKLLLLNCIAMLLAISISIYWTSHDFTSAATITAALPFLAGAVFALFDRHTRMPLLFFYAQFGGLLLILLLLVDAKGPDGLGGAIMEISKPYIDLVVFSAATFIGIILHFVTPKKKPAS